MVTLYYLGEMTTKEIGKFLGVSVNTIKSRLRRARKRVLDDQELFVQKVLGGVQLSENLTSHIMRQIADLKPTPPPTAKPLVPWVAFSTATLLIVLLLGASHPYLTRYQKPYSFEAESEPTIEIIDVSVTLNIDSKPDVRNQVEVLRPPVETTVPVCGLLRCFWRPLRKRMSTLNSLRRSGHRQVDPKALQFLIPSLRLTAQSTLTHKTGIYTLAADAPAWTRLKASIPPPGGYMSMTEHHGILYIVSSDEIFASSDSGETWNATCPRPKGEPLGLIITDASQITPSPTGMTMYLALRDNSVFRSTDAGKQWEPLNEGLTGKRIYEVAGIGSAVFAGTNEGLYRLNSEGWERLPIETFKTNQSFENEVYADIDSGFYRLNSEGWEQVPIEFFNAIHFLKVFENNLYVGMGPDLSMWHSPETKMGIILNKNSMRGSIFHSADLGESWTEITPKNDPLFFTVRTGMESWVAGETLIAQGVEQFRSTDAGKTWTKLDVNTRSLTGLNSRHIGMNGRTFYAVGTRGVYRTTDSGESWHPFMDGITGTMISNLVAFNNRLYAYTYHDIVQSTDGGELWKSIQIDPKSTGEELSRVNLSYYSNVSLIKVACWVSLRFLTEKVL